MDNKIILSKIGNTQLIKLKQESELTRSDIYGKENTKADFLQKNKKCANPCTGYSRNPLKILSKTK